MRRILILAATLALAATAARAQDMPPLFSEKGPNFPTSQRGPAYPAVSPDQGPAPSFGAQAPAAEQRNTPQAAQPEYRVYSNGGREYPAQPQR
jgi:hypothetical protein